MNYRSNQAGSQFQCPGTHPKPREKGFVPRNKEFTPILMPERCVCFRVSCSRGTEMGETLVPRMFQCGDFLRKSFGFLALGLGTARGHQGLAQNAFFLLQLPAATTGE